MRRFQSNNTTLRGLTLLLMTATRSTSTLPQLVLSSPSSKLTPFSTTPKDLKIYSGTPLAATSLFRTTLPAAPTQLLFQLLLHYTVLTTLLMYHHRPPSIPLTTPYLLINHVNHRLCLLQQLSLIRLLKNRLIII